MTVGNQVEGLLRHRFTGTGSYLLPFFRNDENWKGSVLGGWTLSTVIKLASGTPFTTRPPTRRPATICRPIS